MSTPSTPSATLRDFPDRLSPIVVKELRQGLRQHGFVLLFIFLQAVMAVVVFVSLAGTSSGSEEGIRAGKTVSGFFFALFIIAGLAVQPLRGLNALAGEVKQGTIDLLLLTRLDAWRITLGKWLALFSQTTLLLIAILPYLIMRYYLGGMQLFNELLLLFTLFVLSAALTAMAVGFSATTSIILRIILGLALAIPTASMVFGAGVSFLLDGGRGSIGIGPTSPGFFWAYSGGIALTIFVGYYFLELGATQIAPPSENRSTRKRLLGFAVLALILFAMPWEPEARIVIAFFLCLLLGIDALTESPDFTASVTRPFRKLGIFGRTAAQFLYPGWPAGTVFTGAIVCMVAFSLFSHHGSFGREGESVAAFGLTAMAGLFFAAVILSLAKQAHRNTFSLFIVVTLASYIVAVILYILGNALDIENGLVWLFVVLPPLGVVGIEDLAREDGYLTVACFTFAVWWVLLFLLGMTWRANTCRLTEVEVPPAVAPAPPQDEA